MRSTYSNKDVEFLLTDITDLVSETSIEEKEKLLQSGACYSEFLPEEYLPTKEYQELFLNQLKNNAKEIAFYIKLLADKVIDKKKHSKEVVLVSLARAGVPIGVLLKRYIEKYYNIPTYHYAISIIRGLGIDENALHYILKSHNSEDIVFVDGWTGKGAIQKELIEACLSFEEKYKVSLDSELAVLADTGHCTKLFGTRSDFLIPSACLNSTVSGLVSRTFYRKDIIADYQFHGAKYYKQFENHDVSNLFIDSIEQYFPEISSYPMGAYNKTISCEYSGWQETEDIRHIFDIPTINMVKPGVGETTRVLLRRVPWKILVKDKNDKRLEHILLLAKNRNVEVVEYPLSIYNCIGLIKKYNYVL